MVPRTGLFGMELPRAMDLVLLMDSTRPGAITSNSSSATIPDYSRGKVASSSYNGQGFIQGGSTPHSESLRRYPPTIFLLIQN